MKHKMKVMFMIGSILCVVILMLSLIQKKRVEKEAGDLCEINAMTQENQENGNVSVLYNQENQELSFTDNVMIEDICLSFDVITYLHIAKDDMDVLNRSSLERETSPSNHASLLQVYWGDLYISEQSIRSEIMDSSLILDGMAVIETKEEDIHKMYHLKFHYAYDRKENLVYERSVGVE